MRTRSFKRVLRGSLALLGLAALALAVAGFILDSGAATSTVGKMRFANELAMPPLLEPRDAEGRTRRFELQGSSRINGKRMDMGRIDDVVSADSTEIWEVRNDAGTPHNFRVHDVSFRVLNLQHVDRGMMGEYVLADARQRPTAPLYSHAAPAERRG